MFTWHTAWPPKKVRYFPPLTHWDSSLVVRIFLIVDILYLVGGKQRFLALWVKDLGPLNSFYHTSKHNRKPLSNHISLHTPNRGSREDVLCSCSSILDIEGSQRLSIVKMDEVQLPLPYSAKLCRSGITMLYLEL